MKNLKHVELAAAEQAQVNHIVDATEMAQAEPVARDWPKIDAVMRDYVAGYEMIGDNNEVCYSPTKAEQELIIDCVRGLLAESDFIDLLTAQQQPGPVARIKTVGGYPDDSRHELELLVKHGQLSDGQLLYATQPPAVAVPEWGGPKAYHEGRALYEEEIGANGRNSGWREFGDIDRYDQAHWIAKAAMLAAAPQDAVMPADVAKDAARYRWLRDNAEAAVVDFWSDSRLICELTDEAIDAAQKGGAE